MLVATCGDILIVIVAFTMVALAGEPIVSGKVLDVAGLPLGDAQIQIVQEGNGYKATTMTDSAGNFAFSELPDGQYKVTVSKPEFVTLCFWPLSVAYPAGFHLEPKMSAISKEGGIHNGAELHGSLSKGGKFLNHAKLCLTGSDPKKPTCTMTTRFGQYFLELPPGSYRAEVFYHDKLIMTKHLVLSHRASYGNLIQIH